jgi:hypothetical protein
MKSIDEEKAGSVARHRDSATVSFELTFVAVFCFDVSLSIASYSIIGPRNKSAHSASFKRFKFL